MGSLKYNLVLSFFTPGLGCILFLEAQLQGKQWVAFLKSIFLQNFTQSHVLAHAKESHLIELCPNVPENTMSVVFQGKHNDTNQTSYGRSNLQDLVRICSLASTNFFFALLHRQVQRCRPGNTKWVSTTAGPYQGAY